MTSATDNPIGIDIGGSGIKGALVDLATGEFATERIRIPTPQPATPDAVASVVAEIVTQIAPVPEAPVGVTVPAIIKHGIAHSAANIDKSWINIDVKSLLEQVVSRQVTVINDADAAGYAETVFGAARDVSGVVMVLTLGTGIGSALINDGKLVPNTELGHLEIDGKDAERHASAAVRERKDLTWKQWAKRLQRYFSTVEFLFSPDLFVVGGGVSKRADEFLPLLDLRTPVVPATLRNAAGIIGAATLAHEEAEAKDLDVFL